MSGLHELVNVAYSEVQQQPAFRLAIDAHQRFFLTEGNYEVHIVDDHSAYKYRYDLHGYLMSQDKAPFLNYATMRLNKMTSPNEFNYDRFKALILPSEVAFKRVVQRYMTSISTTI